MNQTDDSFQEAKSQWIEKMTHRTAVLHLILHITIKGRGIRGYRTSTGDRLGRWEKAKQRSLWDCIESKTNGHITSFTWVDIRWLRVNNEQ